MRRSNAFFSGPPAAGWSVDSFGTRDAPVVTLARELEVDGLQIGGDVERHAGFLARQRADGEPHLSLVAERELNTLDACDEVNRGMQKQIAPDVLRKVVRAAAQTVCVAIRDQVDQRSDLYSVGVVLYELLTGKVPFTGESPVEIAMTHLSDTPPPPSELHPDVPEELDMIVMRALA